MLPSSLLLLLARKKYVTRRRKRKPSVLALLSFATKGNMLHAARALVLRTADVLRLENGTKVLDVVGKLQFE